MKANMSVLTSESIDTLVKTNVSFKTTLITTTLNLNLKIKFIKGCFASAS